MNGTRLGLVAFVLAVPGCIIVSDDGGDTDAATSTATGTVGSSGESAGTAGDTAADETASADSGGTPVYADVVSLGFGGSNLDYNVSITISSPDTGCEQYADWWEVVSADGQLVFREVFDGPHLDQQPFVSMVAGVPIESDVSYLYRVHMHPWGYGGMFAFRDQTGGPGAPDPPDYSMAFPELAELDPQPPACTE